MDGLRSIQPGAFASAMCGCGDASCVEGCKVTAEPEPEPEPEPAIVEKRGMLTREEAEEMAEKTAKDIAAAKAAEAAERTRELAAAAAQAEADAAALGSALEALDAFSAEQLRRVAAYRDLAEALRVLLERGDLFKYQKTCAAITAEFASCSQRIMAICKNLRTRLPGGAGAAAIIDAVQTFEEKKLQLTVALQVRTPRMAGRGAPATISGSSYACGLSSMICLPQANSAWPLPVVEQLHKAQAPKAVLDLLHPVDDGCEGCSDPEKNAQMEASIKELSQQLSQASPFPPPATNS